MSALAARWPAAALPALLLWTACIDLDGAEQQLCQDRPGLCPTSPGAPSELSILGLPEPCRTVQADVGSWTPDAPDFVQYQWFSCLDDSETSPCVVLSSADPTQPSLTVTDAEVGRYLRVRVVTQDAGRTFEFSKTVGPVQRNEPAGRQTAFFTGFEALALEPSNLSREGSAFLVGGVEDAHWGTAVLQVEGGVASKASVPIPGVPSTTVFRFAFRHMTPLPGDVQLLRVPVVDELLLPVGELTLRSRQTKLELRVADAFGADAKVASLDLVAGAWFEVEIALGSTVSELRANWTVAGADQPHVALPQGRSYQLAELQFGPQATVPDVVVQYDDVVIGLPNDGFPMGDLRVEPLRPEAAGQHLLLGAVFATTTNGDQYLAIPNPDELTAGYVADWPVEQGSTAKGILQLYGDPGAYAEHQLADLSAWSRALSVKPIFAVRGRQAPLLSVSGYVATDTDLAPVFVHGVGSPPIGTSLAFRDLDFPRGLSGSGGWTTCEVNALRTRFGFSQDASGLPVLDAVMAEVLVLPL